MIEQYLTPSKFLNYDRAENSHLLMCFNLLQYFSVAFLHELSFFFSPAANVSSNRKSNF